MTNSEAEQTGDQTEEQPEPTEMQRQMDALQRGEVLGVLTGQVPITGANEEEREAIAAHNAAIKRNREVIDGSV